MQEIDRIVSAVSLSSFQLSKVRIGTVLRDVMQAVRRHRVKVESNFATLVISIVILEGVWPVDAAVTPVPAFLLILGVDRILDMCRTTVNVTGDATVATVIAHSEGQLKTPE